MSPSATIDSIVTCTSGNWSCKPVNARFIPSPPRPTPGIRVELVRFRVELVSRVQVLPVDHILHDAARVLVVRAWCARRQIGARQVSISPRRRSSWRVARVYALRDRGPDEANDACARHTRTTCHREDRAALTVGPYPVLVLGPEWSLRDAIREPRRRLVGGDFTLHPKLAPPSERRHDGEATSDANLAVIDPSDRPRCFRQRGVAVDRRETTTPPRAAGRGESRMSTEQSSIGHAPT